MTDIRKACKIFLDFIYENGMIPSEIVDKLKQSSSYGDIRKICSVLQRNSDYGKYENDDKQIAAVAYLFNALDRRRKGWLESDFINRGLNSLKSVCNDFFHNVYEHDSDYNLFASTCSALIERADFIDKKAQCDYIEKINDVLNVSLRTTREVKPEIVRAVNNYSKISEDAIIVAYCFSTFEHTCLYPSYSQTDAFIDAADKLNINKNTLKQIRDAFDGHNNNPRAGYHDKPLVPKYQKVKDMLEQKSREEIIKLAKDILRIG